MQLLQLIHYTLNPNSKCTFRQRSPAVPPVDALRAKVKSFVDTGILGGHPERLWVNPDCGLKTRDWPEVPDSFTLRVNVPGLGPKPYARLPCLVKTSQSLGSKRAAVVSRETHFLVHAEFWCPAELMACHNRTTDQV